MKKKRKNQDAHNETPVLISLETCIILRFSKDFLFLPFLIFLECSRKSNKFKKSKELFRTLVVTVTYLSKMIHEAIVGKNGIEINNNMTDGCES